MPTLEERVAYLEGRGEEHAAAIAEVRFDVRAPYQCPALAGPVAVALAQLRQKLERP